MTILDHITAHKRKEVAARKEAFSVSLLERSQLFGRSTFSLAAALRNSKTGIIAEHKRRSPSKSVINDKVLVQDVAKGYEKAGVSGMSVLTDTNYFGGSLDDLLLARSAVSLPLLRKEFIIDTYQIFEAKAYGADAILLIAAILSKSELIEFSTLAKSLELDVLLEVHDRGELERSLIPSVDMLGVNNRNLKTFAVDIETSKSLSEFIPKEFVKVSESGISSIETIHELRAYGFEGYLIGENFMKTTDPGKVPKIYWPIEMSGVKLKICGMKYNTVEVAKLQPDYLGFIFYAKSPRNFDGEIPSLPYGILKVGVFVDATKEYISEKIKLHDLDVVQLHGDESVDFCSELRQDIDKLIEIWKVFRLKDEFDFSRLKPFEIQVDKFLFDTKGREKGGTGHKFNWNLLQGYNSKIPLILSGGIGLEDIEALLVLMKTEIPIHAIDVNSRFEIKPGLKNINDLKQFIHEL